MLWASHGFGHVRDAAAAPPIDQGPPSKRALWQLTHPYLRVEGSSAGVTGVVFATLRR